MLKEIVKGTEFLVQLLRVEQLDKELITASKVQLFKQALQEILKKRYTNHWWPDKPIRGSGYRCLRIHGKLDSSIATAANEVGLALATISAHLPAELTVWIDPAEVSYRIGENGSICTLWQEQKQEKVKAEQPKKEKPRKAVKKYPRVLHSPTPMQDCASNNRTYSPQFESLSDPSTSPNFSWFSSLASGSQFTEFSKGWEYSSGDKFVTVYLDGSPTLTRKYVPASSESTSESLANSFQRIKNPLPRNFVPRQRREVCEDQTDETMLIRKHNSSASDLLLPSSCRSSASLGQATSYLYPQYSTIID